MITLSQYCHCTGDLRTGLTNRPELLADDVPPHWYVLTTGRHPRAAHAVAKAATSPEDG